MIKKLRKKISHQVNKKKIKCLVWDFDGTLYQNPQLGQLIKQQYFVYLKNNQIHLSEKAFDLLSTKVGGWGKAASLLLSKSEINVLDEIDKLFDVSSHLDKNPQIVKFVENLKQFKHIILSNSSSQQVKKGLRQIGFKKKQGLDYYPFEKIIARDELKILKPDYVAFESVIKYTGLKPNEHLMVGDSYHHDIEPAQLAGMQASYFTDLQKYL